MKRHIHGGHVKWIVSAMRSFYHIIPEKWFVLFWMCDFVALTRCCKLVSFLCFIFHDNSLVLQMLYVYRIMQKNTISGTHIRTSAVAEGTTLKHRTKLDCINHWRCGYWLFRRYTSVLSGLEMFHDINLLLLTDWLWVSVSRSDLKLILGVVAALPVVILLVLLAVFIVVRCKMG